VAQQEETAHAPILASRFAGPQVTRLLGGRPARKRRAGRPRSQWQLAYFAHGLYALIT